MFNKSSDVMIPLVVSRPIEPQMNWKRVMFSFRGRINRSTFWSYIGLSSLLYLVLALILMLPDLITEASEPNSLIFLILVLNLIIINRNKVYRHENAFLLCPFCLTFIA